MLMFVEMEQCHEEMSHVSLLSLDIMFQLKKAYLHMLLDNIYKFVIFKII